MQQLFLSIDTGILTPRLFNWLDLLRALAPVRLTAAVTPLLAEDRSACSTVCRRLQRFCLEKDIRLNILTAAGDQAPDARNLLLSTNPLPVSPSGCQAASSPALLLPEDAALPAELILLYDGTAGSLAAIREFAERFPSFKEVTATLLYIQDRPSQPMPDEAGIRALGEQLYHKFRILTIPRRPPAFFEAWLGMMTNPWIIFRQNALAGELIRIRPMAAFAA